jgi:hypothetical protein
MTNLARLRVTLSGSAVVGPSVLTLYQDAAHVGLPAATLTWLNAIKANFPPSLTFTVPDGGDTILDTNGSLIGTWSDGGGGTVVGTGVGGFLIGTGARVRWGTAGIVGGRRVVGTTFLVPLQGTDFDSSGRLAAASRTALQTPTSAFLTAMGGALMIWSRPKAAQPLHVPPLPARSGSSHAAVSATIPFEPTTLRSRRT